jgi:hypothetical protein
VHPGRVQEAMNLMDTGGKGVLGTRLDEVTTWKGVPGGRLGVCRPPDLVSCTGGELAYTRCTSPALHFATTPSSLLTSSRPSSSIPHATPSSTAPLSPASLFTLLPFR